MTKTYKELIVWQKSYDLSLLVYELTKKFPKSELYALTSQLRRAVVSIPSNIAKDLKYIAQPDFNKANDLLIEVMKMLNSLILKIRSSI